VAAAVSGFVGALFFQVPVRGTRAVVPPKLVWLPKD